MPPGNEFDVMFFTPSIPFTFCSIGFDNKSLASFGLIPSIPVDTYDERYTSKIAKDSIIEMGKNKKFRQEKSNVDKISASIILQSYLTRKNI